MTPIARSAGLCMLMLGMAAPESIWAAAGDLDLSFGGVGSVRTPVGSGDDFAYDIALQPDGKVLLIGSSSNGSDRDVTLVRYHLDGSLDATFGGTGIVTTAIAGDYDVAGTVALQPDDKIVAIGTSRSTTYGFVVLRYGPDGSLDTSFDGDGIVTTAIGLGDAFNYGGLLQPDGRIVAVGDADVDDSLFSDMALVRYGPDGSLDTSFGAGGIVITTIGEQSAAYDAALQPDGKIVAAGWSGQGISTDVTLVRYHPDGSLDTSFGGDGIVTTTLDGDGFALDVAVQPDGKIVTVGYLRKGSVHVLVLIRYRPDGSLDAGFGSGGVILDDALKTGAGVALQPDGKIVTAGTVEIAGNQDIGLARWNTDGSLDGSFGNAGIVRTALGSFGDSGQNLVMQADGTIVVAGYSSNGSDADFAVAQYHGSTCGDATLQSPEQCDDGNRAGADGCSAGCMLESCGVMPVTWCRVQSVPGVGLLSVRDDVLATKDVLLWQWAKGSTTLRGDFGDPAAASDYLLCLYRSTAPRLLISAAIPAGETCDGRPCWRGSSSGFKYKNKGLAPDGVSQVSLRSGAAGRAKISLKGTGAALAPPAPPLTLPVTVQLVRLDSTVCWEATYSAPSVNAGGRFKAKGN